MSLNRLPQKEPSWRISLDELKKCGMGFRSFSWLAFDKANRWLPICRRFHAPVTGSAFEDLASDILRAATEVRRRVAEFGIEGCCKGGIAFEAG